MDNDLMATRFRPPSEPNRPGDAPFIPPPAPAPWEPKPAPWQATQSEAPLNQVPWESPATPSNEQATRDDEWPDVDLTPAPPAPSVEAAPSAFDAPDPNAYQAPDDDSTGSPPPQSRAPVSEMPWDRPAPGAEQLDAQAGGASWDTPAPFGADDEPSFFDDRPVEMLDIYDQPAAVATPAVARPDVAGAELAVEAPAAAGEAAVVVASDPVAPDPYDADAPIVPEVARQALTPSWPTWSDHLGDNHEVATPPAITTQQSIEIEPETPAPWAMDWPATQPAPEVQQAKAIADGAPARSEPQPPTAAPDGDAPAWALSESTEADAPVTTELPVETGLPTEGSAEADAEFEPPPGRSPAESPAWAPPETPTWVQSDTEQWAAPVDAMTTEMVDASPPAAGQTADQHVPDGQAQPASSAEQHMTTQVFTVPIDAGALAKGPTTLVAAGPDAGLPGNLVLRIELAIVEDPKPASPMPPATEQTRAADTLPPFADEFGGTAAAAEVAEATEEPPASSQSDDRPTSEAADPATPPSTDEAAGEPWPTAVDQKMEFAASASTPIAARPTFEPRQTPADPWTSVSAPAAASDFEAPAAIAEVPESDPPMGSVDESDEWWVSPPEPHPQPVADRTASHPPDALRPPDASTSPVMPLVPTAGATTEMGAWPSEAAKEDLSAWPPIWEPAQGSQTTAPAGRHQPPPAAEAFDWGWPATTALTGAARASDAAQSEVFASPAWPAAVQPAAPAPLASAAPAPPAPAASAPLAPAAPAPRVSTIEAPQNDLWFLAAEPASVTEESVAAADAEVGPRSSLLTLGLTVGMAVVVVVLVLVFVQLMTSLLR